VTRIRLDRVDGLFPGTDSQGWAVRELEGELIVTALSLTTGRSGGPVIGPIADATDAAVVSAGSRVLVTTRIGASAGSWLTYDYELGSKGPSPPGEGASDAFPVALLPDGGLLGALEDGTIERYPVNLTYSTQTRLGRLRPGISSLQVSEHGDRAIATVDGAAYLFDPASQRSFSDPIQTQAPRGAVPGWLAPNGNLLLTDTADGLVMWNLTPQVMAERLCDLAGRNPTYQEWWTNVGKDRPYVAPCPGYATADEQLDQT
jgi:hypothetical protein